MFAVARVIRARLQTVARQLPFVPRAFKLAWQATPGYTSLWLAILVVQGVLPAAVVLLTRAVVDRLVAALGSDGSGWDRLTPLLPLVVTFVILILAGEGLAILQRYVRQVQAELVGDHLSERIQQRATRIDLAFYERPEYFDQLHRARLHARDRPLVLLENAGAFLSGAASLLAMVVVLATYGPWLPLLLVASILPMLFTIFAFQWHHYRWRRQATSRERQVAYYDGLMTSPEAATEVRLFDLGSYFGERYRDVRRQLRDERLALAAAEARAEAVAAGLSLLVLAGGLLWMSLHLIEGRLKLGDFALFYQSFHYGQRGLRALLASLGEIYGNVLTLGDFFRYLELESKIIAPALPRAVPETLQEGFCLRAVTFRYPGSRRAVLANFDLQIPAGKTVAIVGANGAGKSTILKLICRLYDPQEGCIELDGIDLRSFDPVALRRKLTVLSERPMRYNANAAENIRYGEIDVGHDREAVIAAARAAGVDNAIERLPEGYETLLGKGFAAGAELSRGEWQRLALARAFLRAAPIVLLDEPTRSLDSWNEIAWQRCFAQMSSTRTVLIITHRLTIAARADIIHVLDQGKIIESGKHEELLEQHGKYAESWDVQTSGVLC